MGDFVFEKTIWFTVLLKLVLMHFVLVNFLQ